MKNLILKLDLTPILSAPEHQISTRLLNNLSQMLNKHNYQLINDPINDLCLTIEQLKNGEQAIGIKSKQLLNFNSLVIDFNHIALINRIKSINSENLIKACLHKNKIKHQQLIIDATGGLAIDSILLASTGAQVELFERNPLISGLLFDAQQRADSKLNLPNFNFCSSIDSYSPVQAIDTIYLDPMFPKREKSSLVKKPMQILQNILHNESLNENNMLNEQLSLLNNSLQLSPKRIVVKRPNYALPLKDKPTSQIKGKNFRFDIYQL